MNIGRRGFLAALTAAFVVDPERLLWVPGKKLISIAKPQPLEFSSQSIDEYVRMVHSEAARNMMAMIDRGFASPGPFASMGSFYA